MGHSGGQSSGESEKPFDSFTPPPAAAGQPAATASDPQRSWFEIAKEQGTDKVTDHEYQYMYEKYLPALRNKKVKMLEIGLGCNMVRNLFLFVGKPLLSMAAANC
jgi:hypothetical protein